MPRPPLKKHKPNRRSPSQSRRIPPNAGLSSTPRVKLQQQLANKPIGQRPQDSDDSDRLVTRAQNGRSRRNAEQVFASGGVAKGDKPGIFPTKKQRSQRLRSETNEIIRRSRSKSVEDSVGKSPLSRSISANDASTPAALAQSPAAPSPRNIASKSQSTPTVETSILGTLKPRKRQASILHMIDNNDSSIINPEDEEQFLPDDESTPLNVRANKDTVDAVPASTQQHSSATRKRKLGSEEPITLSTNSRTSSSVDLQPSTPSANHAPIPGSSAKRQRPTIEDEDVMALPQSSSVESSPQKPKPSLSNKSKKTMNVPTTEQLQSLMPSKRRKGARERKVPTEFDIPDSSESSEIVEIEDESSAFLPRRRATTTTKKPTSSTKPRIRTKPSKGLKATVGTTPAGKTKPTKKSTSIPPAALATPRTPLPLTRNPNQENKSLPLTRTPRGGRNQNSKLNRDGLATVTAAVKSSGGSRPRRGGRRGGVVETGAESDKENSGVGAARVLRKRTLATEIVDGVQPSVEEIDGDGGDPDVEMDRLENAPVTDAALDAGGSADVRAWKNKWADIDNWSLDYEEVNISTGSSSPLRVSVV